MIKKILLTCLMALPFGVAMADELPYMTFETLDGGSKTISVEGLKITFTDGIMTAQNTETTYSVPLANLSKMYFSSTDTHIAPIAGTHTTSQIHNLQGQRMRTADPTGTSKGLPTGIYIVTTHGKTRKEIVK